MSNPIFDELFDSATAHRNRPEQLKACQRTLESFVAKEIVEVVADPVDAAYMQRSLGWQRKTRPTYGDARMGER